jgi:hypothetical protein
MKNRGGIKRVRHKKVMFSKGTRKQQCRIVNFLQAFPGPSLAKSLKREYTRTRMEALREVKNSI